MAIFAPRNQYSHTMKTYNNSEEMMAVVKKNYEIQVAAIKVYDAKAKFEAASADAYNTTYDWTHKDEDGNRRFFEAAEAREKAEMKLKKAVKSFFAICGKELPLEWNKMCGFETWMKFQDYIKDLTLYHIEKAPIETFSLLSTC